MTINFFNLFDIFNISVFEISIILCQNKFYHYFRLAIIISIVIDLNIIKNLTFFYYNLDITINCLSIFLGLIFKVNMNNFSKKQVFNIGTSILLKYIGNNFVLVFIM